MSLINRDVKHPSGAFSLCHKLLGRRLRRIHIFRTHEIIFCTRAYDKSESAENVSIFVL